MYPSSEHQYHIKTPKSAQRRFSADRTPTALTIFQKTTQIERRNSVNVCRRGCCVWRFGDMRRDGGKDGCDPIFCVAILPKGSTAPAKCKRPKNRCRHRLFCRDFAAYSRQSQRAPTPKCCPQQPRLRQKRRGRCAAPLFDFVARSVTSR